MVRENKNDLMEEMFRGLRTNLLFMLGKDERVILFSSTQPGEGQVFRRWQLGGELGLLGQEGGGGRYGHPKAGLEQGVQYLP